MNIHYADRWVTFHQQGAIKVPVSAQAITLKLPNLFSPSKTLNHKIIISVGIRDGTSMNKMSNKVSYTSPPPRQSPRQFVNEEFMNFVRPQDRTWIWIERDSDGMPDGCGIC